MQIMVSGISATPAKADTTLREAFAAWRGTGKPDPCFAASLESVGNADRPPDSPWGS